MPCRAVLGQACWVVPAGWPGGRAHGYKGCIDIEGWHDPVYEGDLEMTGQVHGLNHLKHCRGGAAFVPNPHPGVGVPWNGKTK